MCACVLSYWLNVCGGHVEICEILLKWFQKKVDQQKNGKTYFGTSMNIFQVCEIAVDWCVFIVTRWKFGWCWHLHVTSSVYPGY